jgi:C-5 cytosine-specific DNA methylase
MLAIDLFCGLGGWAEGFLAEGYDVIGFDIERRPYPGQLVLQDVRTIDGYRLRRAAVIVASPPCDDFSRWDQPWANVIKNRREPDLSLWHAAERIGEESGVPLIIENVRGAQKFMGPARTHFGKQYLWGDVPALLPYINGQQNEGRQKQTVPSSRKAERAKIPFPLAQHIAACFKPTLGVNGKNNSTDRAEQGIANL